MDALITGEQRPSAGRRIAAVLALVLGALAVVGASFATLNDPFAGVGTIAAVAGGSWLVWQGAQRRTARRAGYFVGAALVLAAALVALARRDGVLELVLLGAGLIATTAAVRSALGADASGAVWTPAPELRRPVLLINLQSGGGKAERFALADRARARGVEAIVLEPGDDVAALARRAVRDGADALGIAGGDGSLALVAEIAAACDIPIVCVPAGTRNHFALDLGIDREDPVGALDAFAHGIERRVDLAEVNGRTFLNNVSLGLYAEAIQRPAYRDAKLRTLLETLGDVATSVAPVPGLEVTDDLGHRHTDPKVVLVSNNPYGTDRVVGKGSRPLLDTGRLGVVVIGRTDGHRRHAYRTWTTPVLTLLVAGPVRAGADGEAATLEAPLRFASRPGALRVRISSRHAGVSPSLRAPRTARSLLPQLGRIAAGAREAPDVHAAVKHPRARPALDAAPPPATRSR